MEEAARAPLIGRLLRNRRKISGAALTGLQFVVMALVAEFTKARHRARNDPFGTLNRPLSCACVQSNFEHSLGRD